MSTSDSNVPQDGTTQPARKTTRKAAPRKPREILRDGDFFTSLTSAQASGQVRVAEAFLARYRNRLMHVDRMGWHEWVGSHWKWIPDKRAIAAVQILVKILFHEALALDPKDRDLWFSDLRKCESASGLAGVAKIAAGMPGISFDPDGVDSKPHLFAFRNSLTYDLYTDEVYHSRPEDRITKVAGCDYDPDAECPNYDRMLAEAQTDDEIRAYLHRIVGSALEGRVREQMLPVFNGLAGAGKGSTVNDSWLPVFGDYGQALPVEVLLSGSKDYMSERLSLKGARLVVTSEPKQNSTFNAAFLKLVAGGDRMSARPLYSNKVIQWDPTHQVVMLSNFRPEPPADDGGVWRRLKPVDWMHAVPEERRDGNLPRKLAEELSGIANRILDGWKDFRDNGLQIPESCRQSLKTWQHEVDILGQFLEYRCVVDPANQKLRAGSSALFKVYESFCHEANEDPGTNKAFSTAMKLRGFRTMKYGGIYFVGIGLKDVPGDGH